MGRNPLWPHASGTMHQIEPSEGGERIVPQNPPICQSCSVGQSVGLDVESERRKSQAMPASDWPEQAGADNCTYALDRINAVHRNPCVTGVGFSLVRLGAAGVANDINYLVKMLHFTLMHARAVRRPFQLIMLPPAGSSLSVTHPWHWLQAHGLSNIFRLSSCHEHLLQHNVSWLEEMHRELPKVSRVARVKLYPRLYPGHPVVELEHVGISWQDPGPLPRWLSGLGRRWWWSMLTTYLIRIEGELEAQLMAQPSLLRLGVGSRASWDGFLRSRPFSLEPCAHRPKLFDIGLHNRQGDACGQHARLQPGRRCLESDSMALALLHNFTASTRRARIFLASDSASFVEQARQISGPHIYSLAFNRTKYDDIGDHEKIETAFARRPSAAGEVLVEGLLDLFLLSRAKRIAGAFIGNFPRVAMQMRLQLYEEYVALDRRQWCGLSKCVQPSDCNGCAIAFDRLQLGAG